MAAADSLTAEHLREVLHYEPTTGVFTWSISRPKCAVGAVAGRRKPGSYVTIKIDYVAHYAHRLAWLYMTGSWPDHQVDHENLDKSDNRWENLRAATQKQNSENMARHTRSASGVTGVYWHGRDKRWMARITHHRKKITLGYFKTIEEAAACRREAEVRLFTHSPACKRAA
jgi:hypothetical protein